MKTNKQKATQRVATIGIIARHGRRCNNALGGVFAEQKLQRTKLTWMLILFAITIAFIACKEDDPPPPVETPIGSVGGIPIYGFNSATAIANINTAWNHAALDPYRDKLSAGIKKIYIVAGDAYSFDKTTGKLELGTDWSMEEYVEWFVYGVYPQLSMKMFDNSNAIRIAIQPKQITLNV